MIMSRRECGHVLGVKIDNISYATITKDIEKYLNSSRYHRIVTLNPEILLTAHSDTEYKKMLNNSDLKIVDGFGIHIALLCRGQKLKDRVTGIDLMYEILKKVDDLSGTVFLAAHLYGLSSWTEVKNSLEVRYPHITFLGDDIDPENFSDKNIENIFVDVVFCNFGAPEQEMFLSKFHNGQSKIGIGVGGSFDFATGTLPRAPQWMRKCGIEWLYRLYKQPRRWRRICNAVIFFPVSSLLNIKNDV